MKENAKKNWIMTLIGINSLALFVVAYFILTADDEAILREVIMAYCGFALFSGACLIAVLKKYPEDNAKSNSNKE